MAVIPADLAPRSRRYLGEAAARLGKLATALGMRAHAASRVARARAGYASGVAVAAWGVGVNWGFGWALIVAGMTAATSFLLLYPVDESRRR